MKNIFVLLVAVCLTASLYAKTLRVNFDSGKLEKEWTVEGDAGVSTEQKHSGTKSLKIVPGSTVSYIVSDKNVFGKIAMWVYDAGTNPDKQELKKAKNYAFGGLFGVINEDEDKMVFGQIWADWLHGNTNYNWASSAASSGWAWGSRFYTNLKRSTGWHKWVIDIPDEKQIDLSMDDNEAGAGFSVDIAKFNKGFTGLYFEGPSTSHGSIVTEPIHIDDIEIDYKEASKK